MNPKLEQFFKKLDIPLLQEISSLGNELDQDSEVVKHKDHERRCLV